MKGSWRSFLLISILVALASCSSTQTTSDASKVEEEKRVESYTFDWNKSEVLKNKYWKEKTMMASIRDNNKKYTEWLVFEISNSGLIKMNPTDMKTFGYKQGMDRVQFWGNLLVEMMLFESSWKTSTVYKEPNVHDGSGDRVNSRGLFQISIESSNNRNRGNCKIKTVAQLHDAKTNIWCALRTFVALMKERGDNRIAGKVWRKGKLVWAGPARYWSVLRGTNSHTGKALAHLYKAQEK